MKMYFAINMWEWPEDCADCEKLITTWEDADCVKHTGVCLDCYKAWEMSKEQWEQDEHKQDMMRERYEKHR